MTEICLHPDKLFALLDELSHHRALTTEETDMLETVMTTTGEPFRWNPRLECQLLIASASWGGVVRFARRHGITEYSIVYQKLHRLKKRQGRKDDGPAKLGLG